MMKVFVQNPIQSPTPRDDTDLYYLKKLIDAAKQIKK